MKAYSYIRFSSDVQTWGDSERRQEQMAKDFCARKGLTLAETSFADRGVSGWRGKNRQSGAFARLLQIAKPGDCILIEDNDRFSREDVCTALNGLKEVVQRGITVAFLKTGVEVNSRNFNDPSIIIPNFFQAYLGNQETEKRSFRLAESWTQKRGRLATEKMTSRCVGWLRLSEDRKKFEVIPSRAAVVKRIFKMVLAGHGKHFITKTLNREKVPTFGRAEAWHASYIQKILENRAVIGEFAPHTKRGGVKRTPVGDPIPNYYPAIISKEVFASATQLRKARPSYRGKSGFNVFSHLVFDRETKKPMAYVNKGRSEGYHYLVSSAAMRGQAKYASWQYDEFLGVFLLVCEKAALTPAPKVEQGGSELDTVRMELEETEKQIERLVDYLARGSSGSVESKLRTLETNRARLVERIKELESETLARPVDLSTIDWKDRDALRENLRATVKRITVDAAKKAFLAEFLDGRKYSLSVDEEGVATITAPETDGPIRLRPKKS